MITRIRKTSCGFFYRTCRDRIEVYDAIIRNPGKKDIARKALSCQVPTDQRFRKSDSNKNDDRLYRKYADGKDSRKYSSIELKSKEPEAELTGNTFPLKRAFPSETRPIPFFFLPSLFYAPAGKPVCIAHAKMPDHPIWHPFFPLKFICLPDAACPLNDGADCAQNHQCTAK